MHIHKLTLERFRGAINLPLTLDERLNVFVGMNGAGKSTVLDAAAILLSWLSNRVKHTTASGRPITESDIHNEESSAELGITLNHQGEYFSWNVAKVRRGHSRKDVASVLIAATQAAKALQAQVSESNGQANLPLLAYYPVNRAVLDIPLRIRGKHRFDVLSAYDEALTSGANFRTFFEWFREREDLENEIRRDQATLFADERQEEFPDPQLQCVRRALSEFLPQFKNPTVRRNPLRMEVEKDGRRLSVDQLSDGEKCLMAMVGDLARRMAIANPARENPLAGEGIVLIDEIDLHLHPRWQRMLVPKLLDVFPHCQFLISTHSPHVITHVQPENLFLLRLTDEGIDALHPTESYGKTVERVLEDLMGLETTRPNEVADSLSLIYQQIDKGDLPAARQAIGSLEDQIGDDAELVKAKVLIKRKELIGK
jgi:predicted ATP-binding protein involved in virulence